MGAEADPDSGHYGCLAEVPGHLALPWWVCGMLASSCAQAHSLHCPPLPEPIFSSEDIMAQMPVEGHKFGIVDRTWREIMTESVKDAHALVVTSQDNMLGRLQKANQLLEEIQKGLNDYLEKKRLYFPR